MKLIKEIKNPLIVLLLFLIGGAAHIVLYGVDLTNSICQIFYGMCVIIWAMLIRKRIIDKREKNILCGIAFLLLLDFVLQECRYQFVSENITARRYIWYAYYTPMILIPVLFLLFAFFLNLSEEDRIKKRSFLFVIPGVALASLVLTNDLHKLVFKFEKETDGTGGTYSYGISFYLIYVCIAVYSILALVIFLKKNALISAKKRTLIPALFLLFCPISIFMGILEIPKINGICVWRLVELYAFIVIGFAESCIQTGLIQANVEYKKMFRLSNRPIKISDLSGNTLYASQNEEKAFKEDEDTRVFNKDISGGIISWAADISTLNALNRNIKEVTEQIATRNEFLRNDISVKEEYSKLDTRNKLYDNIALVVKPQLEKVQSLIDNTNDDNFNRNISEIAVLNAYIKRRSNMELMDATDGCLPSEELFTALFESCSYICLCNTEAVVSPTKSFLIPKEEMIAAFDFFEAVVEENLYKVQSIFVSLLYKEEMFSMRIALSEGASFETGEMNADKLEALGGKIKKDCDDATVLTLSFSKGGDSV